MHLALQERISLWVGQLLVMGGVAGWEDGGMEGYMEGGKYGRRSEGERRGFRTYRLNISEIKSISCSAAAIFSADEGWGRPRPNIDIVAVGLGGCLLRDLRRGLKLLLVDARYEFGVVVLFECWEEGVVRWSFVMGKYFLMMPSTGKLRKYAK